MGRGTTGSTGMPGSGMNNANVGQLNSSDRFLRQNRRTGSFVGADSRENAAYLLGSQTTNTTTGRTNTGLLNNRSMMPQNFNRTGANRNNFGGMQGMGGYGMGGRQQTREVRTALSVAFDHPKVTPDALSTGLSQRLQKTQGLRLLAPVQVGLDPDGSVILRGHVATERDRALAERLALLEPGVWRVRNELEVSAGAPTIGPASPASGGAAPTAGAVPTSPAPR
jgi:hypothetical protein